MFLRQYFDDLRIVPLRLVLLLKNKNTVVGIENSTVPKLSIDKEKIFRNNLLKDFYHCKYCNITIVLEYSSKDEYLVKINTASGIFEESFLINPNLKFLTYQFERPTDGNVSIIHLKTNSILSKELKSSKEISIDISGLDSGWYVIHITDVIKGQGGYIYTKNIMKVN